MAEKAVKPYMEAAQELVDEQAILDKYNAATVAQFNVQREQNRQAENQFYNQMYNTQKTAMDTIRQANAAAVSSGASRGVQAANELSALLGLEQESVASATELAQANRQTAQEETAAVLENVLNAYQQASQERSQLVSQGIEAASLKAAETQANAAEKQVEYQREKDLMDIKANDPNAYYAAVAKDNNATDFVNMTDADYANNLQTANNALTEILQNTELGFNFWLGGHDFKDGAAKNNLTNSLKNIYTSYGLDTAQVDNMMQQIEKIVVQDQTGGPGNLVRQYGNETKIRLALSDYVKSEFNAAYQLKYNLSKQ